MLFYFAKHFIPELETSDGVRSTVQYMKIIVLCEVTENVGFYEVIEKIVLYCVRLLKILYCYIVVCKVTENIVLCCVAEFRSDSAPSAGQESADALGEDASQFGRSLEEVERAAHCK